MIKILVVNGPNLQLLGQREPSIYGGDSLEAICDLITKKAMALGVEVDFFQSNVEGEIVTKIGIAPETYNGIIINAAAYTHTSVALRDAIKAINLPCVEVHLSNIAQREDFRHKSYISAVCIGQVAGFGSDSYLLALDGLVSYLQKQKRGAKE